MSLQKVTDAQFIQGFIRVTNDAASMGWHERNGGNLSYRIKPNELAEVKGLLSFSKPFNPIGVTVKNLANEFFVVTGTGRYFSNIMLNPQDNIAIVQLDEKGESFRVVWGLEKGGEPTSEFPTHLMNHSVKFDVTNGEHRVIMHSHPSNTIAMTFVLPLEDKAFTIALWEMMTECPIIFPDGVGVVPWMVPGGKEIAIATSALMRKYDVAIWAHHGVFCSGSNFDVTYGLMETVEKAAEIFVKVMSMGGKKQTITSDDFRILCKDFNITISEDFLE